MTSFMGYSDGACKRNPGPGGWGAALYQKLKGVTLIFQMYGGTKSTTNNEMELTGALNLIKMVPHGVKNATLHIDSQYVLKGIVKSPEGMGELLRYPPTGWIGGWAKNGWRSSKGPLIANVELWKCIAQECKEHFESGSKLRFVWVKGHSGVEGNELADSLANKGVPK